MSHVGDVLKDRRRKLGKSLRDAENATRIRAALLSAIEDGNTDALPHPAYVRNFIVSYGTFLGLDVEELLKMYHLETAGPLRTMETPEPEPLLGDRNQHHLPLRLAAGIAALIAVIALSWWGMARAFAPNEEVPPLPAAPAVDTQPSPGIAESAVETTPASAATSATDRSEDPDADTHTVRVEVLADGASWFRVTIDGLKAYEGTLAGGQAKQWDDATQAVVLIGRPGAARVLVDGKPMQIGKKDGRGIVTVPAED